MIHPRQGVMLCYPFDEKRLARWDPPYIVQPKINGIRAVWHPDKQWLVSSQGNVFKCLPHITDYLKSLPPQQPLDGELYHHGMPLEDIQSRVSQQLFPHSDYKSIQYYVFDVQNKGASQVLRHEYISSCLLGTLVSPLYIVPTYYANSMEDIEKYFDKFIDEGYEGIIVRNKDAFYRMKKSTNIMKLKLRFKENFLVTGCEEEFDIHGYPKNSLGAFTCTSPDVGANEFNVGTGFTRDQRIQFWQNRESLIGRICTIAYPELTADRQVPRHPVFKGFI
jgi:DNA ligase 1